MRALPQLEPRRGALEKCVFCPKLCRSACPVSNAEPRETITPWGKMSLAWMAAHGDVPVDTSHAAPAWACTGCYACREACDHRNGVADVLLDARSALARAGVAPEGAKRVLAGFVAHEQATRAAAAALTADHPRVRADASDALLVGCGYLRAAPREARAAIDAATALSSEPVSLAVGCCGLPLLLAGDGDAFVRHGRALAASLKGRARVTVVDPGCAMTLRRRYLDAGIELEPPVELLVERAARALGSLQPVAREPGPVRWHDPCQLGRGLGVFEAPRAVLGRLLGCAPDEFDERREWAACSGAGGLLPSTMPATSRDIAQARIEAHARGGGGRIVTACASSLLSFRRRAAGTGIVVDDLVTWLAAGSSVANSRAL
jgi:Fe-S oxidoreductase